MDIRIPSPIIAFFTKRISYFQIMYVSLSISTLGELSSFIIY